MKTLILISVLASLSAFGSVESDSEALSQSFNTTPLGRTNIGYRTVDYVDETKENENYHAQVLACKKDPKLCPRESAPAPRKTVKKNIVGKALELTDK